MITEKQILNAGASALAQAFKSWLDENRQAFLQLIAQAILYSAPGKPAESAPARDTNRAYLTKAELAERWRCCPHTVARKIRVGELACFRTSRRRVLIPVETVLQYEKGMSQRS